MKVFVTGATGHIGSAVVADLIGAGHQVIGLARSDASAAKVEAAGADPWSGDIDDLDGLRKATEESDGAIHLAFKHDLMASGEMERAIAADKTATEAIGEALSGTDKPFVNTSATLMLAMQGLGRTGTEEDRLPGGFRADAENATLGLADGGVRSAVVRLPPVVHSDVDAHGFIPTLIGIAREKGFAGYPTDGANHWPGVNTFDAATLFRLAVESARPGTVLHGVQDEGLSTRELAEAIGRGADLPVRSVPEEDVADHFGPLASFIALDNPVSSALTREWLGWEPAHPDIVVDLDQGHYFAETNSTGKDN